MSKLLKTIKAKALDFGLRFLSIDEKIAYIAFKTNASNVKPIVILPTTYTTVDKLKKKMLNLKRIGNIYNGTIEGIPVSIIRAGVGGPHVAMIMEGLKRSPCKMAIPVDFCGGLKSMDSSLDIADVIIPEEERNEITMAPGLVINTSMIEKFLTVSFSTGSMNLNSMILRYDLDSLKIALESVMRRNVAEVSESEINLNDASGLENNLSHPD